MKEMGSTYFKGHPFFKSQIGLDVICICSFLYLLCCGEVHHGVEQMHMIMSAELAPPAS